jgi:hypothetical protein
LSFHFFLIKAVIRFRNILDRLDHVFVPMGGCVLLPEGNLCRDGPRARLGDFTESSEGKMSSSQKSASTVMVIMFLAMRWERDGNCGE